MLRKPMHNGGSSRDLLAFIGIAAAILLGVTPAAAQKVGEVGVDWLGNDIVVEAIRDPAVEGVTCHVSFFERVGFRDFVPPDRPDQDR